MAVNILKIGLTGGIGSGKSIVSKLFGLLKMPVYNSDLQARFLMNSDIKLIRDIKTAFGDHIYDSGGFIDRIALSSLVFSDPSKLEKLNKLVHPVVMHDFENWLKIRNSDYAILESAILFETGIYKLLDKNICVFTPSGLRISRIMQRDGITLEKAMERIQNQLPDKEKIQLSDFVIINDEKNSLVRQVLNLHREVLMN